jgi:hypothetical protein
MRLTTAIILIITLCACSNKNTSSIITIDVQTPVGSEMKKLSEIATDIQYIPLETRPEALMRFVNYLKATDTK